MTKGKGRFLKQIGGAESTTVEWKESLATAEKIINTISAFSNTEGGTVYIGVTDAGEVIGVKIGKRTVENFVNLIKQKTDPQVFPKITVKNMSGKNVIIIDVQESRDHLVLASGLPYKRVGKSTVKMSKDEYERLIIAKHKDYLYFDKLVCKGAKISDISKEKVVEFVKKAKQERGLDVDPNVSVTEILGQLKLLTKDKKLTNGAVLLFGKDTQEYFLRPELKAIRFKGYDETGEMIDFKTFTGDAITLHKNAENFIYEHIPMKAWIEKGKTERQEKWLYPPDAIREGLANALAHRLYESTGKVQVRIFDDRMEIWNPGALPPELTFAKLKRKHDSIPRNPSIAHAFFWIRYAEEVGTGTKKIVQWCKEWGLPEPKYEEAGGSFVLTFRNSKYTEEDIDEMDISERQKKAIRYLREHGQISNLEYRELNKISKNTATRDLSDLLEREILRIQGQGRSLRYTLKH